MALLDRLARDDPQPVNGHIANHSWSAALWFRSKGEVTDAQVIAAFNLSAEDQVQYNQIIAFWTNLLNTEQAQFHSRLESAGILLEDGLITRAKYKNLLGIA